MPRPSGSHWLWAGFPVALNYAESHILTLPEQVITICEWLVRLGVKPVVNELLFWVNYMKLNSILGLISTSLQLKELINNICQTTINLMWQESRAVRCQALDCFWVCKITHVCVHQWKESMHGCRTLMSCWLRSPQHLMSMGSIGEQDGCAFYVIMHSANA